MFYLIKCQNSEYDVQNKSAKDEKKMAVVLLTSYSWADLAEKNSKYASTELKEDITYHVFGKFR